MTTAKRLLFESPELFTTELREIIMIDALMHFGYSHAAAERIAAEMFS